MVRERRGNVRVEASLAVALYYNSLVLLSCQARDISPDGVFVDTGGQLLPQNAMIDVRFDSQVDGRDQPHRLQAEVKHIGDRGIGLKFAHTDYASFVSLVNLFAAS